MLIHDLRNFNPNTFAKLDGDMWVAYYNHRFFQLFTLLLQLNYTYFGPNPFLTSAGAYHSALAAIVFRKTKGHEDNAKIILHLVKFYKLLSSHNVHPFDYQKAAELELEWWFVDRYPNRYKKSRAIALAEGMAVIYNIPVQKLKSYGKKRAEAMELLGNYHHSTTVPVDWEQLQSLLRQAYQALSDAVQA